MSTMHRFSRMHLSPEVARDLLDTIDLDEKSKLAEGIALIAVIDERRDYLEAGYSCMLNYCMGRLHHSKDKALKRIQVAKAALRFPDVFEGLADGRLSITTASVLAPHLEPETAAELLAAAAFQGREEIIRLLAVRGRSLASAPVEPLLESLVDSTPCVYAPGHTESHLTRCECVSGDVNATASAPTHVEPRRRGRVSPSSTGDYKVRLTITQAEHEDLRKAQALLGHAVPNGDPAVAYARAMKHYVAHLEKERLGVKPGAAVPAAGARRIPKALRRFVWERDGARCAFVSADGHRCEATFRLEVDHITPVALGGKSTADNLRLLCSAHNQHEAERVLDKQHVHHRREIARRERARDRAAAHASAERQRARAQAAAEARQDGQQSRDAAAAQASSEQQPARDAAAMEADVARAKARDAARQERYEDVYAGLRGLRADPAEARRGAEVAAAMPEDATLEECMKAALTVNARPLLVRCKHLARRTE
jgi:hypothetical protein